jgi:hypothetical protein
LAKAKYDRNARECPSTMINVGLGIEESFVNWLKEF